jgi:ribonuclease E
LRYDRARVQLGKISRFGLMELSRQRLRPSLGESSHEACPRCHGTGHIRGTESTALHILRILQEESMKENTATVHAQVPVDVATFLLNEKRLDIQQLETRHRVTVTMIPNTHLQTPNYTITRLRHDDLNQSEPLPPSYQLVSVPEETEKTDTAAEAAAPRQEAAVKGILPPERPPTPEPVAPQAPSPMPAAAEPALAPESNIIGKIFGWFRRKPVESASAIAATAPAAAPLAANAAAAAGEPEKREEGRRDRSRQGPRKDREGGRDGGGRNRHRNERGERPERGGEGERGARTDRPVRPERGERSERGERTERGERPERDDSRRQQQRPAPLRDAESGAAASTALAEAAPSQDQSPATAGGNGETRGRGRRRGRGRGNRPEGAEAQTTTAADTGATDSAVTPSAATGGDAHAEGQPRGERRYRYPRTPFVPRPRVGLGEEGTDAAASPSHEPSPESQIPTPAAPQVSAVPMPMAMTATVAPAEVQVAHAPPDVVEVAQPPLPVAAPVAAPVAIAVAIAASHPPAETQAAAPSSPAVEAVAPTAQAVAVTAMPHVVPPAPLKLDWSSDLTQIETDRAKAQAALTVETSQAEPPRKPRVRPAPPPAINEPLVQVETQRGESASV